MIWPLPKPLPKPWATKAIPLKWLTRQSIAPVAASLAQLKQFTADASHELRTPLTAIQASAQVLQSHPERIHPGDIEKVSAIATAANRMGNLVKDLLLMARLDAQAPDQQGWQAIDLDELLEDLVELHRDRAQAAQLALTYQFERFWRTEEARHHYRDESGLGLAIAKTIVERHHGHISVQSQPHQGTCFEVKLPC